MNIKNVPFPVLHDHGEVHHNITTGQWSVCIEPYEPNEQWVGEWGYFDTEGDAQAFLVRHTVAAALREQAA